MKMQVAFDEQRHEYTAGGLIVPSVTQVIARAGLTDFSKVDPDLLARAQRFGTAGHKACELYDLNIKAKVDPAVIPYLEAWIMFIKESGFKHDKIERTVFSSRYWYAGKPDRIGWFQDKYSVIEIKVSNCFYPSFELQTAAYQHANNEMESKADRKVRKRYVVQLYPNKYEITPCEDVNDIGAFLGCLQVCNFKIKHKMK